MEPKKLTLVFILKESDNIISQNNKNSKKKIIEIHNITYGGDGIGNLPSGKAIFVPKTIPGEKHLVEVVKEKKNYAYGKTVKLLHKTDERIKARCEIFEDCGGCQWQHMDYESQKEYKEDILKDSLNRIGKINDIEIRSIIGMDYPWFYRNKAIMPVALIDDEITAGFYKRGTHQVVDNHTCYIQHQLINRIKRYAIEILNQYDNISVYNEKNHAGLLRHLHIRVGVCTNQALLTFITTDNEFEEINEIANRLMDEIPELVGVVRNINSKDTNVLLGEKNYAIKGQDYINDYIGKRKYKISHDSFFQVNTIQAEKLYNIVNEYANLRGDEIIVDAFSGIGSIAIFLKENYDTVYGIESNENAVKDSRYNASLNNLKNCQFMQGDVTEEIPKLTAKDQKPDIVIFDPPRSGLNEEIINNVIDNKIQKVIYVSCNPTTLARDLKELKKYYDIKKVQPVDMFPQTYHVETVVLLNRK